MLIKGTKYVALSQIIAKSYFWKKSERGTIAFHEVIDS